MHWRNSNFQYVYFVLGTCHTAIEAHRKCCEAIEDREIALNSKDDKAVKSKARSNLAKKLIEQAKKEIEFLNDCKSRLEENIGFVPTMDDYQDNQRLEWKLELQSRAESYLLCTGSVPTDHFITMRQHPDFESILNTINTVKSQLTQGNQYVLESPRWRSELQLLPNEVRNEI